MRIIRHSPTGGRNTEFVKGDRTRVNIKVNPSLQYADGIELAASIDDTTTAIVYLRWDDLRENRPVHPQFGDGAAKGAASSAVHTEPACPRHRATKAPSCGCAA